MKKATVILILLLISYFGFAQNLIIYRHFGINNKLIVTIIVEDSQSVEKINYEAYTDNFIPKHIIKLGHKEYQDFLSIALNDQLKGSSSHKTDEGEIGIFKVYVLNGGKERVLYLPTSKIASSYFNELATMLEPHRFTLDLSMTFKNMHELIRQYIPEKYKSNKYISFYY